MKALAPPLRRSSPESHPIHRLWQMRFALPTIIVTALLCLLVNELAYRNAVDALRVGGAFTEARLAAAQQATQDLRDAYAAMNGRADLQRVGERQSARQIAESGLIEDRTADSRGILRRGLVVASDRQKVLQASIDDAMWINRIAVAILVVFGAAGLGFQLRHVRLYDRERAELQRDLEAQVRHRTVDLRELAGDLVTAREDEKAHLARELHDELGAVLTAAKLDIARMRGRSSADPLMMERIEQVNQRLNEGIALKRRIVEDLRPSCLSTLGLTISLLNLCADVGARLGIAIQTDLDEVSLTAEGELSLYRLVQEGLTNVAKYAHATEVRLSVKAEADQVRVHLVDNGIGFDAKLAKPTTHGIAGMRFRIERLDGRMTVQSRPGEGTHLDAILPARGRSA
ncbi:MAG: ATP-binding protein [Burkholderiales bacterium]